MQKEITSGRARLVARSNDKETGAIEAPVFFLFLRLRSQPQAEQVVSFRFLRAPILRAPRSEQILLDPLRNGGGVDLLFGVVAL